ncbi:sensor histidine kinase [Hymenobacter sp. BRD128]|uniref:sensor histidine kinase n=1 Tax=Hymenobacter sp. BRD128 TaxID=2675878 RepID=UPI00156392E7|nr:ATP-binding protein [Hymenobacter sp. BRD128]QKG58398.1 sensor histidine kinase [Hymenobacter sp. BRD128]
MLLSGVALVLFVVVYQKRLLQQQLQLRAAEAEYQQQLLAAVIEAQEHERERIGRDLHDGIGSTLATAKLLMGRLESTDAAEEAANLSSMVKEILGEAVHDVRGLSHSLYPAVLDRFGLAEALQHLADVCNETSTLDVELSIEYQQPLALAQELALYRICQELIHNAQKHARGATLLQVRLRQHGTRVSLAVEDDGCGFDSAALESSRPASGGAGLRSIEVRVQMLRARLSQQSAPGQGTCTLIEMDTPTAA